MRKTSAILWSLSFCVLLSACLGQGRSSSVIPSNTSAASATVRPTVTEIHTTSTPTPTQTPALTPTITLIPPYPTKQVLLDYDVLGSHTPFDLFYTDHGWSKLVIYTDGPLI